MFARYNWFTLLWALFIAAMHAVPGNELPKPFWDLLEFDKVAHFAIFAILSFSGLNGLRKQRRYYRLKLHAWKVVLFVSFSYAIALEFMQKTIFVGRNFQWSDIVADFLGISAGIFIFYIIYRKVL